MQIPGPTPPSSTAATNLPSLLKTLQPGQTLSATVTRQLPNGHVELQIGQTRVSSQPPLPLKTGQSLQLRVEKTAAQQLDLRILNNVQEVNVLTRALRENLPRQTPVARALTQVFQKLADNGPQRQSLPAPARDAIRQLITNLPDVKQLGRADTLRQVIDRSGAKLEAQLQQLTAGKTQKDFTQTDLKANIFRVIQTLKEHAGLKTGQPVVPQTAQQASQQIQSAPQAPAARTDSSTTNLLARLLSLLAESKVATPTQPATNTATSNLQQAISHMLSRVPLSGLLRNISQPPAQQPASTQAPAVRTFVAELVMQLESGLARIQSNQLATVQQEDNPSRPLLMLDLPVNNNGKLEDIHIQIKREQSGSGEELQHTWRVSLYFDFEHLGIIRANIAIHNNQVNTTFHSEQEDTSRIFDKHLDELENNLEKLGLDIGLLKSLHIDKLDREIPYADQSGLVDDKV